MHIKAIIKAQDELKKQIAKLIWMFEAKNKCVVEAICLRQRKGEIEAENIQLEIDHVGKEGE